MAREEFESRDWPHASFMPMTFSAEKVLAFYNGAMKSRLPRSPWHEGRVRLDNGFSNMPQIVVEPPQVKPMNLRPIA
jgi:hypothetical protein